MGVEELELHYETLNEYYNFNNYDSILTSQNYRKKNQILFLLLYSFKAAHPQNEKFHVSDTQSASPSQYRNIGFNQIKVKYQIESNYLINN